MSLWSFVAGYYDISLISLNAPLLIEVIKQHIAWNLRNEVLVWPRWNNTHQSNLTCVQNDVLSNITFLSSLFCKSQLSVLPGLDEDERTIWEDEPALNVLKACK